MLWVQEYACKEKSFMKPLAQFSQNFLKPKIAGFCFLFRKSRKMGQV